MAVRFPALPGRGLGVGLDLPWDGARGFGWEPSRGDALAPALRSFLRRHAPRWSHAFFSWQPRDRAMPILDDYRSAWDDLVETLPPELPRALHHTALNLGALDGGDRGPLLAFTADLCRRYQLRWVNEDVGFWSLDGRPLPYPLPPLLTRAGLAATVANVRACQAALGVPLVLEFPGFSRGVSVVVGDWDAYEFFRILAEETEAPVTLDVAHLLSWRWWRGHRGAALYHQLERLPLEHCFEIHMSGCEIVGDHFVDAHHGALLPEQLELLSRLAPLCPNLHALTFEDPRFDASGRLEPASRRSWRSLRAVSWPIRPAASGPPPPLPAPATDPDITEGALAALLHRPGASGESTVVHADELQTAAGEVRRMVLARVHRGTGGLTSWFPSTVAAWRDTHPDDDELEGLAAAFCASPACALWRESLTGEPGISLEEALYRFFSDQDVGDPAGREEELLDALIRALAVTPRARFLRPPAIRQAPGGCFAVSRSGTLHAAIDGRYLRGPLPDLPRRLLAGLTPQEAAAGGPSLAEVASISEELRRMKLIA